MREAVAALYVVSGVLPLVALVWAWVGSARRRRRLIRQRDAVRAARARGDQGPVVVDGETVPEPTYADTPPSLVVGELVRVEDALRDLRGPALLTAGGVVLATAASWWSLYLPASG